MNEISIRDRKEKREGIKKLESALLQHAQVDLPVKHAFLDGAYFRQIKIPKGTILTGKIHADKTVNIVTKGKIAIATENGEKIIEAPAMFISEPGVKKAGYALEDTIFINGHITFETELDKIESEVITEEYPEIENNSGEKLCHG